MNQPSDRSNCVYQLTGLDHIDLLCDQFEAAYQHGDQPRIEDFLARARDGEEERLFGELLKLEMALLRRDGQSPDLQDYQRRFPERAMPKDGSLEQTNAFVGQESDKRQDVAMTTDGQPGLAERAAGKIPADRLKQIGPYKLLQPIKAHAARRVRGIQKWVRRYPFVTGSLLVGTILLLVLAFSSEKQRRLADQRLMARQHHIATLTLLTASSIIDEDPEEAHRALNNLDTFPFYCRDFIWRALYRRASGWQIAKVANHSATAKQVRFSPSGSLLAASLPGRIQILNGNNYAHRISISTLNNSVQRLEFSQDESLLFVCNEEGGNAALFSCSSGDRLFDFTPARVFVGSTANGPASFPTMGEGLQISTDNIRSDKDWVTGKLSNLQAAIVDADASGLTKEDLEMFCSEICGGCFMGPYRLVTLSRSGRVMVWQLGRVGEALALFGSNALESESKISGITHVVASVGHEAFLAIEDNGLVHRVQCDKDELVAVALKSLGGPIISPVIDPKAKRVLAIDSDRKIKEVQLSEDASTQRASLETKCNALCVASDGSVACITTSGDVIIYRDEGQQVKEQKVKLPKGVIVSSLDFSADGGRVACVCDDGVFRIWDRSKSAFTWSSTIGDAVRFTAISRASFETKPQQGIGAQAANQRNDKYHFVITVGDSGVAKLWRSDTGAQVASFSSDHFPIAQAIPLDDGVHVASLDAIGQITVWDIKTQVPVVRRYRKGAERIILGPDSTQLAVGKDTDWRVLDLISGEWKESCWTDAIRTADPPFHGLSFSQGSQNVAAYRFNPQNDSHLQMTIWNWDKNEEVANVSKKLQDRPDAVWSYTPNRIDHRLFALGPTDQTFAIGDFVWRLGAEKPLESFNPDAIVSYVERFYSPNGQTLFTRSSKGRLDAWDVHTLTKQPSPLQYADHHLSMNVTSATISWDGSLLVAGTEEGEVILVNAGRSLGRVDEVARFTEDASCVVSKNYYGQYWRLDPLTPSAEPKSSKSRERWREKRWAYISEEAFSVDGAFFVETAAFDKSLLGSGSAEYSARREARVFRTTTFREQSRFRMPTSRRDDDEYKLEFGDIVRLSRDGRRLGCVLRDDKGTTFTLVTDRGRVLQTVSLARQVSGDGGTTWRKTKNWEVDGDLRLICIENDNGGGFELLELDSRKTLASFNQAELQHLPGFDTEWPDFSLQFSLCGRFLKIRDFVFDIVKATHGPAVDAHIPAIDFVPAIHGNRLRDIDLLSPDGKYNLREGYLEQIDLFTPPVVQHGQAGLQYDRSSMNEAADVRLNTRSKARPACAFSTNGKWFAVAVSERPQGPKLLYEPHTERCTIHLWELATGKLASYSLTLGKDFTNVSDPTPIGAMAVSDDGSQLALFGPGDNFFNIELRPLRVAKTKFNSPVFSIRFLLDVATDVSSKRFPVPLFSSDRKAVIWEKSGWYMSTGKKFEFAPSMSPTTVVTSGKRMEEARTQSYQFHTQPDERAYIDVAFASTRNGSAFHHELANRELGLLDSTVLCYRRETDGKEIMRLIFHENGQWIAVTPDGCYDKSEEKQVDWAWWNDATHDMQLSLDVLKNSHRVPGLVVKVLNGESIAQPKVSLSAAFHEAAGSAKLYEPKTND